MKTSKYNFLLKDSGFVYWYNSLSNVYFRISDSLSYKIEKYLIRPDSLKELSLDFFNLLVSNGFIINDEIDEISIIREKNNKAIHSKDYYLILLPTLDCNFTCWYCIQNHISSKMDTITLENIKNHLDYMIDNKKIESLNIEWFGGEPFMYFKDIIEPISLYAIKKCSQANIPFRNSSTTNAYYINHSIASKLKGLKFQHFQITLDGSKQ